VALLGVLHTGVRESLCGTLADAHLGSHTGGVSVCDRLKSAGAASFSPAALPLVATDCGHVESWLIDGRVENREAVRSTTSFVAVTSAKHAAGSVGGKKRIGTRKQSSACSVVVATVALAAILST